MDITNSPPRDPDGPEKDAFNAGMVVNAHSVSLTLLK